MCAYSISFSIVINKLPRELKDSAIGVDINGRDITTPFYADNIVLITENAENLK